MSMSAAEPIARRRAEPSLPPDPARSRLGQHWPIAAVIAAFGAAAIVEPLRAPVTIWDDWAYVRAAENLAQQGELLIPAPSAANVVFQAVWGAAFQLTFGSTLGVLRLSTVVLAALSAIALYRTGRLLNASPVLAGLASAAYLFQPMGFVLSYSFMTDPHYVALGVIATWLTLRAVRSGHDARAYLASSVIWAAAYLVRPQAAVVVAALGMWVLVVTRAWPVRRRVESFVAVVLVPVVTAVALYGWARLTGDGAQSQSAFVDTVRSAGVRGLWVVTHRTLLVSAFYLGLFCLPLLPFIMSALRAEALSRRRTAIIGSVAVLLLVDGWAVLALRPAMPFAPSWWELGGLGPEETPGRTALLGRSAAVALTLACLVTAVLVLLLVVRASRQRAGAGGTPRGLLLVLGVGQLVGVLLPSVTFGNPLDRYLLPLLPIILCLVIGAVGRVGRCAAVASLLAIAAFACFSVVETRNFLTSQAVKWAVADQLLRDGVALNQVDAGAGWDGYQTYDQLGSSDLPERPEAYGRWWMNAWGRGIDSTYILWGGTLPGYDVVQTVPLDQWLREDRLLYVNRREPQTYGPPTG